MCTAVIAVDKLSVSGKILCLIALIESLTPIVSALLFVRFYMLTVELMPGLVFIVASIIQLSILFIMIAARVFNRRRLTSATDYADDRQCIINSDVVDDEVTVIDYALVGSDDNGDG